MGRQNSRGLTLDTGALIAFEASDRRVNTLLQRAQDKQRRVVIPAGVLAQVWRGQGSRQARLAHLLNDPMIEIEPLTHTRAQIVGELCARSRTADVIDASVVVAAWDNGRSVVTSDPDDIRRLDPSLDIVAI
jgi:predicted nucleic acid-binding protein